MAATAHGPATPGTWPRVGADRPAVRIAALAGVLALAAFDLFWRLSAADWHFDEFLYGRDGWDAIHARQPFPDHPLLGKYLIGLGQLVVGRNVIGVRVVPVLCSLLATFLVFLLARRLGGWWTGILAATLWAALPRALEVGGQVTGYGRLDRFGLLDTMANAAAIAVLFAAWCWASRPTVARALVTGLVLGAAVAVKLSSALLVVPVLLLGLVMVRPIARALGHLAVAGVVSVGVFASTYLPFGTAGPSMVGDMIAFQRDHARVGHTTLLAGHVYYREPWWTNPSNWVHSQGWLLVLALVGSAFAAAWHRERIGVLFLSVAVLLTMFALAASPVALAHYWVAWIGPLMVLAALGIAALLRGGGVGRYVGLGLLLVLALGCGKGTFDIARTPTGDYNRMAAAIRADGSEPKRALVLGTDLRAYLPGVESTFAAFAPRTAVVDLVVIERQFALLESDQALEALRTQARNSGLSPHVIGDIEYWDAPR